MSGIAGYFRLSIDETPVQDARRAVEVMNAAQKSSDPDHTGLWQQQDKIENGSTCVLGHNCLSIEDLKEHSDQSVASKKWALTYNGEIYNFRTLKSELEQAGEQFETSEDSEVLLHAIECWGIDKTLDRIVGMFAFAAYDREKQTLHLVRDRMGIMPLYFCQRNGAVYFASTPAAIVHGIGKDSGWRLNWDALYGYFLLGATRGLHSLFEGIEKVDAAEMIIFQNNTSPQRKCYWTPQPRESDLEESLREVIDEQNAYDSPSAIGLSGGLDSSVLALLNNKPRCIHFRSPEERMAKLMAKNINAEFTTWEPDQPTDFGSLLSTYAKFTGEPSAFANLPMLIAETAQATDQTTVSTAHGSDALFYGKVRIPSTDLGRYSLITNGYDEPHYSSLFQQLRNFYRSPENFRIPEAPAPQSSFTELFKDFHKQIHLPHFSESASYRWLELRSFTAPALHAAIGFTEMMSGVRFRLPFADHRLIEAALTKAGSAFFDTELGAEAPLKKILQDADIHPIVWARAPDKRNTLSRYDGIAHPDILETFRYLREKNYLEMEGKMGEPTRDFERLGVAGFSFRQWEKEWIQTGVVKP